MADIFELLQHCWEDWSVKVQLKVCCAQAVLTISTGSWHTCLALSCNIRLILSDCVYTTSNLYQLILNQFECCSSILLAAGWAWTKLWLLSPMEIYSSHSEPKRRRAGSAPDKVHTQHDCNDCKWTSTELQPTWAVSHTRSSVSRRWAIMHLCFERTEREHLLTLLQYSPVYCHQLNSDHGTSGIPPGLWCEDLMSAVLTQSWNFPGAHWTPLLTAKPSNMC